MPKRLRAVHYTDVEVGSGPNAEVLKMIDLDDGTSEFISPQMFDIVSELAIGVLDINDALGNWIHWDREGRGNEFINLDPRWGSICDQDADGEFMYAT